MPFLVGVILALSVCVGASIVGFDRDKAFYPAVVLVIASYYALFAVLGGSLQALAIESVVIVLFIVASIAGFKVSQWFAVAALAAHGVFDFVHGEVIENPGVPAWWPPFCLAFDVTAAAYLGSMLARSKSRGAA